MNDPLLNRSWGVPDWLDKTAYPSKLSLTEWRWEFLRRREAYRRDFLNNVERELKKYLAETGKPCPVPRDSVDFRCFMPDSMEKYGVTYLLNPAAPRPRLQQFPHTYGYPLRVGEVLGAERIAIVFDLTMNMDEQFDLARRTFKIQRRAHVGEIKQGRLHKPKFVLYLRVLDAREAKAKWEEIGETLLVPDPEQTSQEEYDAAPDNLAQRAREIWKQATQLRDKWPA